MSILKRCSGYKGHHECADKYPNNMVPVGEFGIDRGSKDGLHHMCHECMNYRNAIHANTRIKHPLTSENKDDWKRRMASKAGGIIGTQEWRGYLKKADADWHEEIKASAWLSTIFPKPSNIAPFSYPPEHEKRLRRDGRTTESAIIARQANRHDGFNYIMEHPAWPERKIGWTYDPPSRLSDFNVCCPHKSFTFPYISVYLEDAKLAESIVQAALEEYHTTGEWYKVSRELAIKTIEDYVESLNDRKKQEMG